MLAQERMALIQKEVEEHGAVTVQTIMQLTNASESTIRRDIAQLDQLGKVRKVFGGATSVDSRYVTRDVDVEERKTHFQDEKDSIARYAARLLEPGDFVFLDAGSTVERMVPYIKCSNLTVVTDSITLARSLSRANITTYIVGGEVKTYTDAVVGVTAVEGLQIYNFTKGFFGTNALDDERGCTTPDVNEAMVKKAAFVRCDSRFVLADSSKFDSIAPAEFAPFSQATIITTKIHIEKYRQYHNIVEVDDT